VVRVDVESAAASATPAGTEVRLAAPPTAAFLGAERG
jgi:hypothetical protein